MYDKTSDEMEAVHKVDDHAISDRFADDETWLGLESQDKQAFPEQWLAFQCSLIDEIKCACLIMGSATRYRPVGVWPTGSKPSQHIVHAAELALEEKKDIVLKPRSENNSPAYTTLAVLLVQADNPVGVISLAVAVSTDDQLKSIKRRLQWGAAWLLNKRFIETETTPQFEGLSAQAFSLMSLCYEHTALKSSAFLVVTEWAEIMGLERVCIGIRDGRQSKVLAVSNNYAFDKRSNSINAIAFAMDEALDQKHDLSFPGAKGLWSVHAQKSLLSDSGNRSVCTLLYARTFSDRLERVAGAITLEHADTDYFTADRVASCRQFSMLVGPLLALKHEQERWYVVRKIAAIKLGLQRFLGEGFFITKSVLLASLLIMTAVSLYQTEFKVSAPARVEGWSQRHMSASIDGYLLNSTVKSGDVVQAGNLLFSLDNRDLKLELLKWQNKYDQLQKQYLEALSKREIAQSGILLAQLEQARAQVDLYTEQLGRTEVRAPFDGVIVKGDLTQRLGSPVKRGELLLELAPLKNYRVIMDVNERDIGYIKHGQTGKLKLSSLSNQSFGFELTTILPVGNVVEGKNSFSIEARLTSGDTQALRPGMQGLSKIDVEKRSLLWIWTRKFTEWLTVWLWTWLP